MSREQAFVAFYDAQAWTERVGALCKQAEGAWRRQVKAAPGDLREAYKYGLLCEQVRDELRMIEPRDLVTLDEGTLQQLDEEGPRHPWASADEIERHPLGKVPEVAARVAPHVVAFEFRRPFAAGLTTNPAAFRAGGRPPPPAAVWRPGDRDEVEEPPLHMHAREAQRELWEGQLRRTTAGEDVALVPSGITNSVLTEGLRAYVLGTPATRIDARVLYRDGSEARRFLLSALALRNDIPAGRRVLRLALMSVRHPEMDPLVDGAVLRNRLISQVRPAAETDELAYTLATEKLTRLATTTPGSHDPLCLRIYQTGLQPAVIGFYRAVAEYLALHPGTLTVLPCYWRGGSTFEEGTPWTT